jgi:hypothetical protein
MNRSFIGALCLSVTFALLEGCGGSQPPISAPGAAPQNRAIAQRAVHGKSWMLPGAKGKDLLYISAFSSGKVYVYTYPKGKLVGTLTGFWQPIGECVDAAGDVFIVQQGSLSSDASTIYEYQHGASTPVATLVEPGYAIGCAADPTTGNLAVGNADDTSNPYYHNRGDIAVFSSAQGNPTMFYSADFYGFGFCGYDPTGNLYAEGLTVGSPSHITLGRLSTGSQTIETVNINQNIYGGYEFNPAVQWDGQHMTISSAPKVQGRKGSGVVSVYQLGISGSNATVVGTTKLEASENRFRGQSWITGKKILAIYALKGYENIASWQYPQGGNPQNTFVKLREGSLMGVTVSLAHDK